MTGRKVQSSGAVEGLTVAGVDDCRRPFNRMWTECDNMARVMSREILAVPHFGGAHIDRCSRLAS